MSLKRSILQIRKFNVTSTLSSLPALLNQQNCTSSVNNVYSLSMSKRNYSSNPKIDPITSIHEQVPQTNEKLSRECVELEIPVPWGCIRGKWWGPTDRRPILGLHGWQDNCGTFDRLAPLLPPHIGFLTIDAPGHGLSSPYPPGMNYSVYDVPIIIRKLSQVFGWQKVSLLGHSLGSIQSFLFSSIYPQFVDFYMGIDIMFPLSVDYMEDISEIYGRRIDQLLKYIEIIHEGKEGPVHTYDECIDIYVNATYHSVTKEYAPYLLNRGLRPSKLKPEHYYFSRDIRLKAGNVPAILHDECLNLAKNIKCPIFMVKTINSIFFSDSKYYRDILEHLKKSCQECVQIEVPGTHHVHLLTPDVIVEQMKEFIMKYDVDDRQQKPNVVDRYFIKRYA